MIDLVIGPPGSCKSLYQAMTVEWLIFRSIRGQLKYNLPPRKIFLNFHLSKEWSEKYADRLVYWSDLYDLTKVNDADIVIDEVAVHLPSDRWADTHFEVRRMLAQHRKRGLEIFCNTQDYKMVDINFRRMLHRVWSVQKISGSADPSPTLPPIKKIWGIFFRWELGSFRDLEEGDFSHASFLPRPYLIRRKYIEMYDTREDIKPSPPPKWKHIERDCELPECRSLPPHKRIQHI